MFLVFNRQKILSYLIAFSTVIVLLGMAKIYKNKSEEIIETFSKAKEITEANENQLLENSIKLNNNWNDNDIFQLLKLLEKYEIKMKIYVNEEWKNNHNVSAKQIKEYGHELIEY